MLYLSGRTRSFQFRGQLLKSKSGIIKIIIIILLLYFTLVLKPAQASLIIFCIVDGSTNNKTVLL